MSKLYQKEVKAMMYNAIETLRNNWVSKPNLMELYGMVTTLTLLLYTIYYEWNGTSTMVDSGPAIVSKHVNSKYTAFCKDLCTFRNAINHEYFGASFPVTAQNIMSRWDEARELFDYLQDYVKARELLENRCKKYHIQDVETETKTLLNQYCCDDIVELVVMMKADGTLTQ